MSNHVQPQKKCPVRAVRRAWRVPTPARLMDWMAWVRGERLVRMNHIHERAGKPLLSVEEAARLIISMSEEEREALKARIA